MRNLIRSQLTVRKENPNAATNFIEHKRLSLDKQGTQNSSLKNVLKLSHHDKYSTLKALFPIIIAHFKGLYTRVKSA